MAYEQALAAWREQMQLIAESLKGMDPAQMQQIMKSMPPQPDPAKFGYNPQQQGASAGAPPSEPKVTNTVQNITRNAMGSVQIP